MDMKMLRNVFHKGRPKGAEGNTAIHIDIEESSIFLYNLEYVELDQNTQVTIAYSTTKLLTVTDILIFISFTFSYVS